MPSTKPLKLTALIVAFAALSSALTALYLQASNDEAVYVIGAVTITDPERLPEYRAISEPMAHRLAGYTPLAFSQPELLDGELPVSARYFVERYDSREQLDAFLRELEASGGLDLRHEVADMHFMVALPAY